MVKESCGRDQILNVLLFRFRSLGDENLLCPLTVFAKTAVPWSSSNDLILRGCLSVNIGSAFDFALLFGAERTLCSTVKGMGPITKRDRILQVGGQKIGPPKWRIAFSCRMGIFLML